MEQTTGLRPGLEKQISGKEGFIVASPNPLTYLLCSSSAFRAVFRDRVIRGLPTQTTREINHLGAVAGHLLPGNILQGGGSVVL